MKTFVADLHCDLTSYLLLPNTTMNDTEGIGCAVPHLQAGNVTFQVMAIYTGTKQGSTKDGLEQVNIYNSLVKTDEFKAFSALEDFDTAKTSEQILVMPSIENASGFCEEDEPLQKGFERLEQIIKQAGRLAYIGITHHPENRFGGGNSTNVGLKKDGKALLEYISERQIPIDFSHTSDQLAEDILNYTTTQNLPIRILASHSNYRKVMDVPRNLPDEFAQEIMHRNGIIGTNFYRPFTGDKTTPSSLIEHFKYGSTFKGAEKALAIGADYFYTKGLAEEKKPFYYKEHENASCYPSVLEQLQEFFSEQQIENIAYNNVVAFYKSVFS